jgi:hypothetical protein
VIPDDLPFDLARIGEVLERHAVRYVVIGGTSGTFHGMVDYRTKDVDLLVQENADNLVRLAAVLTELHAVPAGTTDHQPITGADLGLSSTQWDTDAERRMTPHVTARCGYDRLRVVIARPEPGMPWNA